METHLAEKIIQRIQNKGPISFCDFMEMALYYPEIGYYNSPGEKIGCKGDYYTSPCLGGMFGIMIGKQIEEMWVIINEPAFTIIEYGAGNGYLCHDILTYLRNNDNLYNNLSYYIIEKSPRMREKEKIILNGFTNKVKWLNSITEVSNVTGCVLSNEVVDNFSVHKVVMQKELMELFVGYDDRFFEQLRPASLELKEYLQRFNAILTNGFRTEVNLVAEQWIQGIGDTLKKGFVITIDYGYTADELYQKLNDSGTLLCYYKHTINNDPFVNIGKQDITTHVNFSSLLRSGLMSGLEYCGFTSQSNFLMSLGLVEYLRKLEQDIYTGATANSSHISSIANLIQMGRKLKVFIQKKDLPITTLSGMRFPLRLN